MNEDNYGDEGTIESPGRPKANKRKRQASKNTLTFSQKLLVDNFMCDCHLCEENNLNKSPPEIVSSEDAITLEDINKRELLLKGAFKDNFERDFPFVIRRLVNSRKDIRNYTINVPHTVVYDGSELRYGIYTDKGITKLWKSKGIEKIRNFMLDERGKDVNDKGLNISQTKLTSALDNPVRVSRGNSSNPNSQNTQKDDLYLVGAYNLVDNAGLSENMYYSRFSNCISHIKTDKFWRRVHYFTKSIHVRRNEYRKITIKFDIEKEGSEHFRYHLYTRAGFYLRVSSREVPPSAIHYITDEEEIEFRRRLQEQNFTEYCRYLTYMVFHYINKFNNSILKIFTCDWIKDYQGVIWLTNSTIYDIVEDSLEDKLNFQEEESDNQIKIKAKLRTEEDKKINEHIEKIIQAHYTKTKFLVQLNKIKPPSNIDDSIWPKDECIRRIYGKYMGALKEIVRKDPLNTNKIQGLLNKCIYKKMPLLKKISEGKQFSATAKSPIRPKKYKLDQRKQINLNSVLRNSKYGLVAKIDRSNTQIRFLNNRSSVERAQQLLDARTEKMSIIKFLEEVKKGQIGDPGYRDSNYYNAEIFRNIGQDKKSYVGSINPYLSKKKKQEILDQESIAELTKHMSSNLDSSPQVRASTSQAQYTIKSLKRSSPPATRLMRSTTQIFSKRPKHSLPFLLKL